MKTILSAAFLALALLTPTIDAGTPSSPEISDPADKPANPPLDVLSMWVTTDPENLYFNIKVKNLQSGNPVQDLHLNYKWTVTFRPTGASTTTVEGVVRYVETGESLTNVAGTSGGGDGAIARDADVNVATGVISLTVPRTYSSSGSGNGPFTMTNGMVLNGMNVKSWYGDVPARVSAIEAVLPTWVLVDTTSSVSYTVQ